MIVVKCNSKEELTAAVEQYKVEYNKGVYYPQELLDSYYFYGKSCLYVIWDQWSNQNDCDVIHAQPISEYINGIESDLRELTNRFTEVLKLREIAEKTE